MVCYTVYSHSAPHCLIGKMPRTRTINDKPSNSSSVAELVLDDISEDGKRIVAAIRLELEKIKVDFVKQINDKMSQIESLTEEVNKLNDKVNKLEEKVEEAEAYERKDSLIFSGEEIPPATPGENCTTVICDLLKSKLKLNVAQTDISIYHRLEKRPSNQRRQEKQDLKGDIMSASRNEKPKIYVNENLTPTRKTIMYVLRRAKKVNSKVTGC